MKKVIAFLAAVSLLACAVSCSEKQSSDSAPMAEDIVVSQTMCKEEYAEFPEDMRTSYKLGYSAEKGVELIYIDRGNMFKAAQYDDSNAISSTIDLFKGENIFSAVFDISADGTISAFVVHIESPVEIGSEDYFEKTTYTLELRSYSAEGEELSVCELDMEEYFIGGEDYVNAFKKIGGRYYLSIRDSVVILDESGNILTASDHTDNVFYTEDSEGRLIAACRKGYAYTDEKGNFDDEKLTEYGEYLNMYHGAEKGYDGFKAFFMLDKGVYGLTEKGNVIELMDYLSSMMAAVDYYEVVYAGTGRFAAIGHSGDAEMLSFMNVRPDDYVMSRENVIFGTKFPQGSDLKEMAAMYNKKSDKYNVQIKGYDTLDDLRNAILSGDPPDIYLYNEPGEMRKLANMGALADMYELSEKYGGFKKEDILDNIITAYEYKDSLYMMSQKFQMNFYIGRSDIFTKQNYSYDEFFGIVNNAPEDVYITNVLEMTTRKDVFDAFVTYNISQWIDEEKGECYFDSEEFMKLLEYIDSVPMLPPMDFVELQNNNPDDEVQAFYNEQMSMISRGGALISSQHMLQPSDISEIRQRTGLDSGEYTILYPIGKTDESNTGYVLGSYYSIISNGNCVEGAWDYLNFILSDNFLTSYLQTESSFVVKKKAFDKIMENKKYISEHPVYINESGETCYNYEFDKPLTDEEIEMMRNYISTCTKVRSRSEAIQNIISEEFAIYDSGEYTKEQLAKYIQDRVSTYLSEQS